MMKSKKLISAILAAASMAGGVVVAQATTVEQLEDKVGSYTSRVEQAETRIGKLETKVNAIDTTGIANYKADIQKNADGIAANTNAIATQGSQISQIQQDMAQDAMDRANEMNDLTTKLNQKADKGDVEQNKNDIASNAAAIQKETQKREDAVKGLQDKLTVANGQIENEKTTRENAVNDLQSQVTANKTATENNAAAIQQETTDRQSAVESLKQQIAAEKNDRIYADKAQDKVIETVNKNMVDGFNTINKNVADGFTALNNTDAALQNQVTANKGDIADLQHKIVLSGQAFNAEQVEQIATNKDDIGTIFGQLDQKAYNQADGYVVKHDDTIGGALKNLDKNADKQRWQIDALDKKTGINTPLTNGAGNLSAGVNENTRKIDAEATVRTDADKKHDEKISALEKKTDKHDWKIDTLEKKTGVNTPLTNGATNLSAGVNENTRKIDAEITARENAVNDLQKQVTENKNTISTQGSQISQLQKDTDKQHWQIDALEKKTGVNTPLTNGATNLSAGVNENTRKIDAEAKARDDADNAEKAEREKADNTLQNNITKEATIRENAVNALNSRIGQVESDANKGIAKASALAALHPLDYDPDNKFDIAAAGGFYKGENAFALGAFYRPNRNVMLSMGTTLTSGDNAYNVGLTFKIGKSGKHTEAGLTTADLYAMIGAMQDKMDQQQKKIEELEAKQAK